MIDTFRKLISIQMISSMGSYLMGFFLCSTALAQPLPSSYRSSLERSYASVSRHPDARKLPPRRHGNTSDKNDDAQGQSQRPTEEAVIVTGTHVRDRLARQSTSPIDVVTAAQLARTGQLNLSDAIARDNPSITVNEAGWDAAALTASIRLRGLNPNEVLVLLDGKRRHATANIYADPGPQEGSTPVDLNMIPAAAIDHIEILRDGAAAQYGSDAIAGVVNIITKKTDHGLALTGQTGANAYNGDGWQYQLGLDRGHAWGPDGYVHVGAQLYHTDYFMPGNDALGTGYGANGARRLPDGANGTAEETRESLSIGFGHHIVQGIEGYGLITYAHRHAQSIEHYRAPTVFPLFYPQGFKPLETINENDYAATLGLRGEDLLGFHWNLSTTYGEDQDDIGVKNTVNPAYYAAFGWSPRTVRAETFRNAQWTNDLDFTRLFHPLGRPVNLAFGGEHRLESYTIQAGSVPSYYEGGTSSYAGLMPQNAGVWQRDVWGAYLDMDVKPVSRLDVDVAGRFEHYTNFGNTENGKVSARYDFTRRIALRATISNGFRAPTLVEEHYSALNITPNGASSNLAVGSPGARLLGSSPLKPERSTNATGGFIVEPLDGLHVTADVYQINIRDRIIPGGNYQGANALKAIALTGATLPAGLEPDNVTASYFSNGASTRTQGLDLNIDYLARLRRYGNVLLTLGFNLNRTRLHHLAKDANGHPILSAQGIGYLTTASPRSKIILNAHWTLDAWSLNLRQTRYGQTVDNLTYQASAPAALRFSNTQFYRFVNTPRWTTDLEIDRHLGARWTIAVGANDIFNVRPREVPLFARPFGYALYDQNSSSVPITGGYYYGRVTAAL